MNIKDSYLHSGTHLLKNIEFNIPAEGNNAGMLVATITWAQLNSSGVDLTSTIPINIANTMFTAQQANKVLAGPSSGNAAVPTFRSLVTADIPSLAASKITSGEFASARLPLASTSAKGAILLGAAQTSDLDSAITGKKYWVQMNTNGKLFVNIPWTDTTYKLTVNGTTNGSGSTSLGTLYAVATSNASAANQVWMRNADNSGYAWRTLGSHAFDSTSYLSLSGGTLNSGATISWKDWGLWNAENPTYPKANGGLYWSGTSDWIKLFAEETGSNDLRLILLFGDDANPRLEIRDYLGTANAYIKGTGDANFTSLSVSDTPVSLNGHKHSYTDLTGSSTTANQAIVSSGTANGWTLKTLGSRAFDSTAYLPLAGGTMTGTLVMKTDGTTSSSYNSGIRINRTATNKWAILLIGKSGDNVTGTGTSTAGDGAWLIGTPASSNSLVFCLNEYSNENSGMCLKGNGTNDFKWKGNTVYHAGNIPSNTKDAAGIVAKGVANRVYMTDSTGAPSWTLYDTTVTLNSSKLVTSGAVYTAIADNVASAVLYLGTVTSSSDMTALTSAGKGDFARVTSSFTFTDATGSSVTAHVGDIVYLTNNTPGTASNWIVAHTEIDTNTWTAASTSAAGYIPKLVTGGAALASSSNDYVLSFVNGTDTTPVWKKLPSTAYSNTWRGIYTNGTSVIGTSTGTKALNYKAGSNITITYEAAGTSTGQSGNTSYFNIKISATDTTYKLKLNNTDKGTTGGTDLGTIYAPTSAGTGFLKGTAGENGAITWSWDNSTYNNYVLPKSTTSALGGIIVSNVLTSAVTLTSGNGSTASRYYGVQLDKGGKAFVNIPWTDTKVNFTSKSDSVSYYIPFKSGTTAQAELLYFNSSITINPSTKTITATTFSGALSGNATTATDLKEANMRGWLYQSGDSATNGIGVGTRATTGDNSIGIPIVYHTSTSNDTYALIKTLFRKTNASSIAAGSIYLCDDVHSSKFVSVLSRNATTDDWSGSSTSGSSEGSSITYTAGDGISINNGTISTTRKEWYGTEAQFNAISSLDNNTTYYITAT